MPVRTSIVARELLPVARKAFRTLQDKGPGAQASPGQRQRIAIRPARRSPPLFVSGLYVLLLFPRLSLPALPRLSLSPFINGLKVSGTSLCPFKLFPANFDRHAFLLGGVEAESASLQTASSYCL
jgi:hypothetical protein